MCRLDKCSRSRSNGKPPEKFDPSRSAFQGHSRSSEPTRIDRLRNDFLLVTRSNHGLISRRVGHGLGPSMGWVGLGQFFF